MSLHLTVIKHLDKNNSRPFFTTVNSLCCLDVFGKGIPQCRGRNRKRSTTTVVSCHHHGKIVLQSQVPNADNDSNLFN